MRLTINDPLDYESQGDAKPTLVFIHGYPLDRRMWEAQIRFFKQTNRVIAIDLPGFGERPLQLSTADVADYSMAMLSDHCCECLDQAGIDEPVVLCGLSMGGYVALEFWYRHPKRLQGLVLSNTRAAADTPEAAANRRVVASKVLDSGTEAIVIPMLEKLLSERTRTDLPDVVARLTSMMISVKPETIHASQTAMSNRADFQDRLPKINIPCLVVAGEADRIVPASEMDEFAKRIPNAEFVVIPQSGHLSPMENPQAFNAALERFLDKIAIDTPTSQH